MHINTEESEVISMIEEDRFEYMLGVAMIQQIQFEQGNQ